MLDDATSRPTSLLPLQSSQESCHTTIAATIRKNLEFGGDASSLLCDMSCLSTLGDSARNQPIAQQSFPRHDLVIGAHHSQRARDKFQSSPPQCAPENIQPRRGSQGL